MLSNPKQLETLSAPLRPVATVERRKAWPLGKASALLGPLRAVVSFSLLTPADEMVIAAAPMCS